MKIQKLKIGNLSSGFTLIEVLIASGILALVAGAVLVVSQAAIRSHDTALERSQGYQLVQEGLEIIHTMRDTSVQDREPGNWQTGFPSDTQPVHAIWDPTTRRYGILSGSEPIVLGHTTFTRTYTFLEPPNLPELTDQFGEPIADQAVFEEQMRRVRVEVTWTSQNRLQTAQGTTMLTNWRLAG